MDNLVTIQYMNKETWVMRDVNGDPFTKDFKEDHAWFISQLNDHAMELAETIRWVGEMEKKHRFPSFGHSATLNLDFDLSINPGEWGYHVTVYMSLDPDKTEDVMRPVISLIYEDGILQQSRLVGYVKLRPFDCLAPPNGLITSKERSS